jgi:hypothetical protein
MRTPLIFDIKTSAEDHTTGGKLRTPYPEVGLQLAAYTGGPDSYYGHAAERPLAAVWRARQMEQFKRRYYLLSESERNMGVPIPKVDGGVAILLTPTRYAVHPVKCGDDVFESFLHVVDAAHFQFDVANSIVGPPMLPPHPMQVDESDPFAGLPRD